VSLSPRSPSPPLPSMPSLRRFARNLPGVQTLMLAAPLPLNFDFHRLPSGAVVEDNGTFQEDPSLTTRARGHLLQEELPCKVREFKASQRANAVPPSLRRCTGLWIFWELLSQGDPALIQMFTIEVFGTPGSELTIDRSNLLDSGFAVLGAMGEDELQSSHISVTFEGESAVDAGGVRREFFTEFAHRLGEVNQPASLFTLAPDNTLMPRPTAPDDPPPDTQKYEMMGRFLGLAIMQGYPVPIHFNRIVYKLLTSHQVTLGDVKSLNPEFFRNRFEVLLQHNGVEQMEEVLCEPLTFMSAPTPLKPTAVPLVEGGDSKRVTEDNKRDYLQLLAASYVLGGIEAQVKAFMKGFHDVVPLDVLVNLDVRPQDLEMVMAGVQEMDLDDWMAHTGGLDDLTDKQKEVVGWFWAIVRGMDNERRSRLLAFATGLRRLPPAGFSALSFNVSFDPDAEHIPSAHTCSQNLVLPLATDEDHLRAKLDVALQDDAFIGFGFA